MFALSPRLLPNVSKQPFVFETFFSKQRFTHLVSTAFPFSGAFAGLPLLSLDIHPTVFYNST
jgi:hypothetical protein